MKFVHAADIHLDSPLRGLERYDGAPVGMMRNATRAALENLIRLCLMEKVDLLVIAGDLYDGDWRDYNTGLFFIQQMVCLCRAGIRVVLVRGNHDAASQITRSLCLPEGVFELSTRRPETRIFEDLGVAVHGHGYSRRDISEDLSVHYPEPVLDCFNIGLLHTALDGRAGHDSYAPCSVGGLINKGYHYWALGHVHQREVLCEHPWIGFPGNLQGRHARETGPKGALLVTVEDGEVAAVEHRPLDVVRWLACEVDCAEATSGIDVVDRVRETMAAAAEQSDGRLLAARLHLTGASRAHRDLSGNPGQWVNHIRATVADLAGDIWVEKICFRTQTALDREALLDQDHPLAGLLRSLRDLRDDARELKGLAAAFNDLKNKLPFEYWHLEDALKLEDPAVLKILLDDVEQLLITRLLDVREL